MVDEFKLSARFSSDRGTVSSNFWLFGLRHSDRLAERLVAEDVAKVNPDLVVRDKNGELLTVRYEAVNAMLLNEFLKEHKTVHEQGATIAELKREITALTATVKEQAQIQKVSSQCEVNKTASQIVLNNQ